jgi:hypothetical protein
MNQLHPRVLLVEGKDDLWVIPQLMEANGVNWGTKENPFVQIKEFGGYENLIKPKIISSELKGSRLAALGIMIDADDDPLSRWQSIRNVSIKSIPNLPENIPEQGLVHLTPNGIKFGIWMMPDNKMRGMLETFLAYMIPDQSDRLWQFAKEAAIRAKNRGATFKDTYFDKANIYTWLAWQEEPGRQLHQAIQQQILQPQHPNAQGFVSWFKDLYC